MYLESARRLFSAKQYPRKLLTSSFLLGNEKERRVGRPGHFCFCCCLAVIAGEVLVLWGWKRLPTLTQVKGLLCWNLARLDRRKGSSLGLQVKDVLDFSTGGWSLSARAGRINFSIERINTIVLNINSINTKLGICNDFIDLNLNNIDTKLNFGISAILQFVVDAANFLTASLQVCLNKLRSPSPTWLYFSQISACNGR